MRKTFFGALLACFALFSAEKATAAEAKIDTLSYITGQQIGHTIHEEIVPQMKLDYNAIISTLDKLFASDKSIKAEGITISPENINEVAKGYFNESLQQRVMAAMGNDTAQVFNAKEKKIVSALVGADFAYSMKKAPYEVEKKSFMKAVKDVKEGKEMLTLEQANAFMRNYYTVVVPQKNKEESDKWLAKIAKQKGVQKTASGLLYRIENPGDMNIKANKDEDVVKVLYTGRTREGKVFDSNRWADMSEERKRMAPESKDSPIEFPLNRVIKGWTEGMKFIGKGGRITLWIPAELAYGERGAGESIGPNEALCFDVELIGVTNK
ncbi:MAG: FKBP-type peptidyl-prolyl cis-trans isomerase [Bacteroidaceae bacterium]|nr:FKBP-type peptidyl-prolyl cis-trans isomerase [Bacteroidaceae bacterium]